MKKRISFKRMVCLTLFVFIVLGCLGACSDGGDVQSGSDVNEVFIDPTINEDGKLEYSDEDTTIVFDAWEPKTETSTPPDIADMEEVYLSPTETEADRFEYLDKNGAVAAVWEVLPVLHEGDRMMRPGEVDVWGIDWELYPGEVYTAEDAVEPKDGIVTLYFSLDLTSTEDSYLGYFNSVAQQYVWLEPPNAKDYYLKLTVNSDDAICVALKHDNQEMIKYVGEYRLTAERIK